jgi:hypothetical protein
MSLLGDKNNTGVARSAALSSVARMRDVSLIAAWNAEHLFNHLLIKDKVYTIEQSRTASK